MQHLTVRVPWHDDSWSGRICRRPADNPYCLVLDRIRVERDDEQEVESAGLPWWELDQGSLPPCKAENGAFMSPTDWHRTFRHPYGAIKSTRESHGVLRPTTFRIPAFSALAVPFWWMLQGNQGDIQQRLAEELPPDEPAPFKSPWVFGAARQEALLDEFFRRLNPEESLAFFYTKEGQPISDSINRLVVGIGRITRVGPILRYESETSHTYPLWERVLEHSIRPTGSDGFLLPYHEYLARTGDAEEDERRKALLREIVVTAEPEHIGAYSYAAQHTSPDVALSTLVRTLQALRAIREHGIARGPWAERENWVNRQIAQVWKQRGAFPGAGAVLEALGLRLGTALVQELLASRRVRADESPWPLLEAILSNEEELPQPAYKGDLAAIRSTWLALSDERRQLLQLLSRFDLSRAQAARWFEPMKRRDASRADLSDHDILVNPYRIAESDLGEPDDGPITVGVIDRGLMPDDTVSANHPVPQPSRIESPSDQRRVRAALVTVLREAGQSGDALLSETEALERLQLLDLQYPVQVGTDWLAANETILAEDIHRLTVVTDARSDARSQALQLTEYEAFETRLAKVLRARSEKSIPPVKADWRSLLMESIGKDKVDLSNPRHKAAFEEQSKALQTITTRRATVLTGKAGTGKTSVLGALVRCPPLKDEGILLLAPTGKARVRLAHATNASAMTVAQFLYRLGRYDGKRQRPLQEGREKHGQEKTVVIDEASMLTLEDLAAITNALDLAHVKRLILVGDPNQLPPIGVGRPFADYVAYLDHEVDRDKAGAGALARLTEEVRTVQDGPSDTLRLASWFAREPQPPDADEVLNGLSDPDNLNDLEIAYWQDPEGLQQELSRQLERHLGLSAPTDVAGFNKAMGLRDNGFAEFSDPSGLDAFQILSPVRMHPHGVYNLNRWIQGVFRSAELSRAHGPRGRSLGNEEIVVHDKVILLRNGRKRGYVNATGEKPEHYLANGEIGVVTHEHKGWFNVLFSDRPGVTFGYSNGAFDESSGPLELAYALTIHKAQGSEFGTVFVIIPKESRLLSRELLYTALTRSRRRLVLLIEGDDPSILFRLSRPELSDVGRRNGNLFFGVVREAPSDVPYADHLIHRTLDGRMVRSKSELVIANELHGEGIPYDYERRLEGEVTGGVKLPDFSFADAAGDLIIWEHLGLLSKPGYREGWEHKRQWYLANGFVEGETLFTTADDDRGGLDAKRVREVAQEVKSRL